ncbi:mitochondrial calcium uniporter regulator 1-like [Salvia hispanica]|uniref:mitochondrial calcium uniporter regulator 1-like n=1 Tax=Salvia hispanica TaxID=49212 RepID=UPI00200933E0|nr:mitochondrial calcium uniporter regulator 1-like [Salvia hispanica]
MASCIRMIQSGIRLSKFRGINSVSMMNSTVSSRTFSSNSPNQSPVYLFDTLALIRSLEAQGIHTKQAEAITSQMTLVLNVSMEYILQNVASKSEMQKVVMATETNLVKLKSEVQSYMDNNSSSLQGEDAKIRNDITKLHGELRHEIDKVTSAQRLDLNLERRRVDGELSDMRARTTDISNQLNNAVMANETSFVKLKSEVQSSLDQKFSPLQSKGEKLQNDIEKLSGELKHEIEKITAAQRLDLNLEKRRIDDKFSDVRAEITHLTNKLTETRAELTNLSSNFDRKLEIATLAMKADLATNKSDITKYFLGAIFSSSAFCIGILYRLFSKP